MQQFEEQMIWLIQRYNDVKNSKIITILRRTAEISTEDDALVLALEFNFNSHFRSSLIEQCREFLQNPLESNCFEKLKKEAWFNDYDIRALSMRLAKQFIAFAKSSRESDWNISKPTLFFYIVDKVKPVNAEVKSPLSIVEYRDGIGKDVILPFLTEAPTIMKKGSNMKDATLDWTLPTEGREHIFKIHIQVKRGEDDYKTYSVVQQNTATMLIASTYLFGENTSKGGSHFAEFFFRIQLQTIWGMGPPSKECQESFRLNTTDDVIEVAALGQSFELGMLYDARSEKIVSGMKLWDDAQLQAKIKHEEKLSVSQGFIFVRVPLYAKNILIFCFISPLLIKQQALFTGFEYTHSAQKIA